jgi:chlorobactene glucosyltransferase
LANDDSPRVIAEAMGRVSVIIPARNEEANIERVVRSVARQSPVLEIIVVDDGSTDRTGEILKQLKREIPILRVLRNETLPAGWTGKTYAAAVGALSASADWLLFTDADTVHAPGSLRALLERAESDGADLLSLSPGQETPTWWEKAVIPRVYLQLAQWYPFEDVSRPDSPRAAANGQYMLIRRTTYLRVGGFESVRGEVLEDVAFADSVKEQGGKIVFLPGAEWVRTRMYTRFGEMWHGWTKNLFPLMQGGPLRLLLTTADCFLDVFPIAACFASLVWFLAVHNLIALAAGVVCLLIAYLLRISYAHQLATLGYDRKLASYRAMGSLMFGLLLLNSWRAHRLSRRIEWKGRSYPAAGRGAKQ